MIPYHILSFIESHKFSEGLQPHLKKLYQLAIKTEEQRSKWSSIHTALRLLQDRPDRHRESNLMISEDVEGEKLISLNQERDELFNKIILMV